MKSTGIVRRIDDLGRVVIPKEIRRTFRIREGDPLEIYTDNTGNIILKKYSIIKEISPSANRYSDVLSHKIELPVIISDCDHVVAVSGAPKREFAERRITRYLEDLMEMRVNYTIFDEPHEKFIPIEGLLNEAVCAYPLICAGDVIGSIFVLKSEDIKISDSELKLKIQLAEITSQLLGKHLED